MFWVNSRKFYQWPKAVWWHQEWREKWMQDQHVLASNCTQELKSKVKRNPRCQSVMAENYYPKCLRLIRKWQWQSIVESLSWCLVLSSLEEYQLTLTMFSPGAKVPRLDPIHSLTFCTTSSPTFFRKNPWNQPGTFQVPPATFTIHTFYQLIYLLPDRPDTLLGPNSSFSSPVKPSSNG